MATTSSVALVALTLVAVLIQFLSVSLPYWDKIGKLNFGMWHVCYDQCETRKSINGKKNKMHRNL